MATKVNGELVRHGAMVPLEEFIPPERGERDLLIQDHRQYVILYSGRATVSFGSDKKTIKAGGLLILPSGVRCRLKLETPSSGMWISASDALINGQFMPLLGAPTPEYWNFYHTPIVTDYWSGPKMVAQRRCIKRDLEAARSRLSEHNLVPVFAWIYAVLLSEIEASDLPGVPLKGHITSKTKLGIVIAMRGLLEQHLRDHWSIEEYASRIGVSTIRLNRACHAITGSSPLRLIQERLFVEAKRELATSERTVAEIGYALGFYDPSYFSRRFKAVVGQTPADFRRSQEMAC